MALEPLVPTAAEETNPELADMTRRFWVCAALTAPLLLLAMAAMIAGQSCAAERSGSAAAAWIEFFLATPVVLWGGWPFFVRGWASIINRSPNMFTLIAIGVGVAYLVQRRGAWCPGAFPERFAPRMASVARYFESAAVIVTLVLLGQVLELRARSQNQRARSKRCSDLAPKTARLGAR